MITFIVLVISFFGSVGCFSRYDPFHPCRDEIVETHKDRDDFDVEFCYWNIGDENSEGTQILWNEVEDFCQDWHDEAHSVWILSAVEDQWVWDNIKVADRHLWLGLAKEIWGTWDCGSSSWYWLPQSEGITVDYSDTKGDTDYFQCGDCHRDGGDGDSGYACYRLNWCPLFCKGDFPLGSNGNDEGCAVMYDYNGPATKYNSYWKGLDATEPTWGDMFCNVVMENGEYDLPIDGACKLRVPICDSKKSYELDVCSGHGYCLHDDDCFCYTDYYGDNCEFIHECSSIRADDDAVCSGNGNCSHSENCVCNPSFYGSNCQYQLNGTCLGGNDEKDEDRNKCYRNFGTGYTYAEASELCQSWIQPPTTTEIEEWSQMIELHSFLDEDFIFQKFKTGSNKIQLGLKKHPANPILSPCPPPEGYIWDDLYSDTQYVVAKGQSVICIDEEDVLKWCVSMGTGLFWEDHDCEDTTYDVVCQYTIPTCQGFTNDDLYDVCSSRGECVYHDTCNCFDSYYGSFCDFHECFGIQNDEEDVCNGEGSCIGPDWCQCNEGYGGLECNETLCYFVPSTSPDTCSGHGECRYLDSCYCDPGYGGDDCSWTYPCQDNVGLNVETYDIRRGTHLGVYCDYHVSSPDANCPCVDGTCNYRETEHLGIFLNSEGQDSCFFLPDKDDMKGLYQAEDYCQEYHPLFKGGISFHNHAEFAFMRWLGRRQLGGNPFYTGLYKPPPYMPDACPDNGFQFHDGTSADWFNSPTSIDPDENKSYMDEWESCNDLGLKCIRWHGNDHLDDVICMQNYRWLCQLRMYTCDGYRTDNPDSCNSLGLCLEEEKCTCFRPKGFFGDYCEVRTCFGTLSYEDEVCSGHGDCIEVEGDDTNGACSCDDDWFGEQCDITWCDGVYTNETDDDEGGLGTLTCNGHGECYEPDTCKCEYKYFGDDCEQAYCNWIRGDRDEVCSGHGECWPADVCTCNTTVNDYWGDDCEYWNCYGVGSDDYSVCSSGGACVGIDECECLDGYFFGEKCNITICGGIFSNDSAVCNEKGSCWPYGTCTCETGYYGNCDKSICFDFPEEYEEVCHGNGNCIAPDTCNCSIPWMGKECDVVECFGYLSNETGVCSGNGECIGFDDCDCMSGADGATCNIVSCNGTLNTDHDNVCTGRGNCTAPDFCECHPGYSSSSFCANFECFGLDEDHEDCCNVVGDCIGGDLCDCTVRSTENIGIRCLEWFPFSSDDYDFELYYDFLGDRRILDIPYVTPVELLSVEYNTELPILSVFDSITATTSRRAVIDDPFGTSATANIIAEDGETQFIQIVFEADADLLLSTTTYEFTFIVQDHPDDIFYVFEYIPDEDEMDYADDDDFNPPIIDDNDEPYIEEEEEDEDEDDEDVDDDDIDVDENDDDGGVNSGAIAGATIGGTVFVILIFLILVLVVCLCCCCVLCIGLICCFMGVRTVLRVTADGKDDSNELELQWKFSDNH